MGLATHLKRAGEMSSTMMKVLYLRIGKIVNHPNFEFGGLKYKQKGHHQVWGPFYYGTQSMDLCFTANRCGKLQRFSSCHFCRKFRKIPYEGFNHFFWGFGLSCGRFALCPFAREFLAEAARKLAMLAVHVSLPSGTSCSLELSPESRVREVKSEAQRQLRHFLRLTYRGQLLEPLCTLSEARIPPCLNHGEQNHQTGVTTSGFP